MPINEDPTPRQVARRQLRLDVAEEFVRLDDGRYEYTNHELDTVTDRLGEAYGLMPLAEMEGADVRALRDAVRAERDGQP
jgi:hypothetical protein